MLFASGFFLTFLLPVILLTYWLSPAHWRNTLLLIVSLFFYAWGEPLFVFILLGLTILNYSLVRIMAVSASRKAWLTGYIVLNVGFLGVFKYTDFILETITGKDFNISGDHIPLGISFYAFHAITYGVDVYRNTFPAQKRIDHFALYLFLFPHQIAGPIVTYQSIAAEITSRVFSFEQFNRGMYRFVIGLAKKVILSNGLVLLLEACAEQQALGQHSGLAWIEMLAYTFHIYFDFAGYSDMAIGLGLMFGFHFPENFNRPYTAKSITEFWKRWHMSLGNFMLNYLYIPLGGNRASKGRTYFNLFLVFFLSGLWHGAAWNFILWGIFHGFWLVVERLFLLKILKKGGVFSALWTFLLVLNGWVFFHELTPQAAMETFSYLWKFDFRPLLPVRHESYYLILMLVCAGIIVLEFIRPLSKLRISWTNSERPVVQLQRYAWMALIYVISYSYIVAGSYNPFIYFNF